MIKEKFEAGHEIVSEGDDALSFYVIKTVSNSPYPRAKYQLLKVEAK